ncbi:hypothetical protein MTO96_048764 [Rhipicephalus appendiculatus]
MSRAASSSTGDTKSFWRRPRLSSSQCNATGANRFSGPAIRVAAPASQMPSQRLAPSSPQQLSSDEEDEELRSFLTIREPIPRHAGGGVVRRGGRDDSPSSPASSFDSTRLSPWSTPTSPRWSGSTTPPGSSSLEGHSPGLSASLSSSPFSDASVVVSSSCGARKHSRGDGLFPKSLPSSASASSSPGCKLNALGAILLRRATSGRAASSGTTKQEEDPTRIEKSVYRYPTSGSTDSIAEAATSVRTRNPAGATTSWTPGSRAPGGLLRSTLSKSKATTAPWMHSEEPGPS